MKSFQSIEIISIWLIVFCFQCITGCKNKATDIPFPSEQGGFTRLNAEPVHLSVPKKMNGLKVNFVKPEISKFDLNKLPASVYDSSDFIAFPKLPRKTAFHLALLSSMPFSFQNVPFIAFRPQVSFLEESRLIKVERPHLVSSSSALIYEFGEPLLGTYVNCVLNDKAGFLWLATDQGIYRYDGENLLMIMSEKFANGSKSMAEGRNGRIWVGTEGNGIMGIDYSSGTFIHMTTRQGLACDDVSQIFEDSHGLLWVAESSVSFRKGIDIIDINASRIKHIGKAEGLSTDYVTSIAEDQNEAIWVSNLGGSGIDILDLKNSRVRYLNTCNGLKINAVTALLADKAGNIWMGSYNGKLNEINPQKETITFYDSGQGLKNNRVNSLMCDRKGNVWIGSGKYYTIGNGVEVLDPVGNRIKRINMGNGLSANDIEGIAEDKKGQVWIASVNGLNMCDKNGSGIVHISKSDMFSLSQDSSGLTWICTTNQGLDVLDLTTGLVKSITTRNGLRTNEMQNDLEMKSSMFVGTMKGLEIFDPVKKTMQHIGEKQGLFADKTGAMISDRRGRIWMSFLPPVAGVDILDPRKMTIEYLGKNQGMDTTIIMEIREDYAGMIWLGHINGTIEVIDPDKMTISKLECDGRFSRSNWSDMSMVNDAQGNIWVGSDAGIYVVNVARDSLFRISTEQGLIGNYILSLNRFGDQVYAGTKNGLSVFTVPVAPGGKWLVESFGNADGFRKLAENFATDYISGKGEYFWLDLGITHFEFSKNPEPPPTAYITRINIFNHPQHFSPDPWSTFKEKDTIWTANGNLFYVSNQLPSSSFSGIRAQWEKPTGPYHIPSGLRLSHDSNQIQFNYALVNAGIGDAAHYRYILEGFDKSWSEPTTNAESPNYLNLQPGDYVFKVAGKGRDNQWSAPASFSFIILTPWWLSWWFYLLCFVAIILTLYSFYRFRINQILKVQAIRNRIAADLHDDIGSTLSSISIMSELAKVKSPDSLSLLNSIGESASAIQENMSDLVWVVNPKNDRFNNMVQRMKQFASEILDAKSIAFHLTCDEDVYDERLSMDQRKKVYLFFKEAINNAAKYSCANQVDVHISSLIDQIILTIEDNGNGFNLSNGNSGNGLANFRRRADELKGIFSIYSAINEGTKIQLSFKIT
jgi:ligand-binding sensor domain-containing protein/two-component sensor histidine kinase